MRSCPVRGRAFTLLELLVVVFILVLFFSLLLPSLAKWRQQGRRMETQDRIERLKSSLERYRGQNAGHYPLLPGKDADIKDGDPGYYTMACAPRGSPATGNEHNKDLLAALKGQVTLPFGTGDIVNGDLVDDWGVPLIVRFHVVPSPAGGVDEVVRIWSYGQDRTNGVAAAPAYASQAGPGFDAAEDTAVTQRQSPDPDDVVSWKK